MDGVVFRAKSNLGLDRKVSRLLQLGMRGEEGGFLFECCNKCSGFLQIGIGAVGPAFSCK